MLSSAWAQEATDQAAPADTAAEAAPVTIQDMAQGAEDAPVTIVEYGSFTCPHCAAFHADQYQHLKEDYIDTGKVRFVFREVYFDRFGLWASMIARCGGEMRFFGISDILYDTQRDWIGEGEPAQIAENLRRIGKSAGMDDATLDACLNNEAQAEALVAWYQENAERDGIQSTPTFIINGESHSNMAYDDLKSIIDSELAETQ
ncbi:DsbA family protein [Rubellimicrobium arenae]|uniref:DsbA family protein n=1 Tax=Rubellimicrobium arenae TaxID=2817372 RepID=UPI003F61803A